MTCTSRSTGFQQFIRSVKIYSSARSYNDVVCYGLMGVPQGTVLVRPHTFPYVNKTFTYQENLFV